MRELQEPLPEWWMRHEAMLLAGGRPDFADIWASSQSCQQHDDDPCCRVRTGAGRAEKIRTELEALELKEQPK